jgi:hypothetical protein
MSSAVEKILAEIQSLTPDEQQELRILWPLAPSARPAALPVDELKGKYSFVRTSSDAFAERKQHEIDIEDRRFRKS